MKIKIGDTTYTGIKEKSPAWYIWNLIQAIGFMISIAATVTITWALICFIILALG